MPSTRDRPRRLGLIGGECTGKSTLALALEAALPACRVDESLRDFVERQGRPPRQHEQAALMAEQQQRENSAAATCPLEWLVADPAPLMTAAYSLIYFDDASLLPSALDHALGYDLVAWCDPGIPWRPDGAQRDGPDHRDMAELALARIVETELRPRGITVVRVSGPTPARVDALRRAWQPDGSEPLT